MAKKGLVAKYSFSDILTQNSQMKELIKKAERISKMDGTVLIYGESGTGKELFAQSVHNASDRKTGPFIAVNCAALTESLLESELFGYVGGAFTGSNKEGKPGLFELAHGGTIFLDEINSMSLALQAKILRVIEQKEVMRIGSDYVIPLDVRIVSAANKKLINKVKSKEFRHDLYFRLNTFELDVPAISERREDIILLFRYYLSKYSNKPDKDIELSEDFQRNLHEHEWWGNIREIKSAALRYYAFSGDNSNGEILSNNDKDDYLDLVDDDFKIDLKELNKTVEGLVIESLLNKNLKKTEIADILGISRQALFKKLNK